MNCQPPGVKGHPAPLCGLGAEAIPLPEMAGAGSQGGPLWIQPACSPFSGRRPCLRLAGWHTPLPGRSFRGRPHPGPRGAGASVRLAAGAQVAGGPGACGPARTPVTAGHLAGQRPARPAGNGRLASLAPGLACAAHAMSRHVTPPAGDHRDSPTQAPGGCGGRVRTCSPAVPTVSQPGPWHGCPGRPDAPPGRAAASWAARRARRARARRT